MQNLQKNSQLAEILSYTPAKLYTGKCWYVGFYAYDPDLDALRIKRIKLNRIDKPQARRKYAGDLIRKINEKLSSGWNPWIESTDSRSFVTFHEVVDNYLKQLTRHYQDGIIREQTFISYKSYLNILCQYATAAVHRINYIYQLNRSYINAFLDYIYLDRQASAQTRDNYLTWLRVFCSFLVRKGYQQTNATEGIDPFGRSSHKKNRTVIPMPELQRIREYLIPRNRYYLLATYILFYCFIRPKEMALIRVGDISLANRTIFISADVSKNRRDAVVTLNHKVISLMIDLHIFDAPATDYLFSHKFAPGPIYVPEKKFRDYWTRFLRRDLKLPDKYKFYSLKDTGVTTMLRDRIDTLSVRDQARHSSVLITDIYTPHDIQEANAVIERFDTDF